MDNTFKLIVLAIWFPQAFLQLVVWMYRVQEKEYRLDKFKILLKSSSGVEKLLLTQIILKIVLIFISPVSLIPIGLFVVLDIYLFSKLLRRQIPKPVITKRISNIFKTVLVGFVVIVLIQVLDIIRFETALLLAELNLIIGIAVGVIVTKPLVEKAKKEDVHKARTKLAKIKPKVIGITGSYGKTTTKEFLCHLLEDSFVVEKTYKNQNNEFGVARKILSDFSEQTQVFIAEMGAYKIGEIAAIADFTHPSIGVITGIEEQHLELFGSLENIKTAKYELIDALPDKGMAVFNTSNTICEELAQRAEKHKKLDVYRYKVGSGKSTKKCAVAKITKNKRDGISFEISLAGVIRKLHTNITDEHFIENLTGAILIARLLGVSWKAIEKACLTMITQTGTMTKNIFKSHAVAIDDTYNSTPKGFEAAVKSLSKYTGVKIVVTPGIIELANASHTVHRNLGLLIEKSADILVLTNADYINDFKNSFEEKPEKLLITTNPDEIIGIIDRLNQKDSVFLFEGRLPAKVTKHIQSLYT
ncbi:UDP-N-acetylmuramoyl-tripeptide--D-alanyl-D-alanine ligase [Candidatus Woesebacteria bacterium]|nr:MAG: UDP-N-acetylmuramoyl-tripeptide--D-alanyl-D-alanine ligase [Candidatus Woesebacteria bacterium]